MQVRLPRLLMVMLRMLMLWMPLGPATLKRGRSNVDGRHRNRLSRLCEW